MTSVAQGLRIGTARLAEASIEDAKSEARRLLAHVMGLDEAQVFAGPDQELDDMTAEAFRICVNQRAAGKPFAYITGEREFWSMPLGVSPATLIPRPDSETVIELVIALYKDLAEPGHILDMGTGSGCLLLALLTTFADAKGVGLDISDAALTVAKRNADALGFSDRAAFVCRSWQDRVRGRFDLIVSNPPYIPSADIANLHKSVRDYEPHLALDGGANGLDAYHYIIAASADVLRSDGVLALEVGIGQAEQVSEIAVQCGFAPYRVGHDLSGIARALSFYKKDVGIRQGKG